MSEQMVFKRYEIKYLVSRQQRDLLTDKIKDYMIPDNHGKNTILSLYLDTPDNLLIRRSLDKPVYKEKLRIRSYGLARDDTPVYLELKKKYDKVVYKRRVEMTYPDLKKYLCTGEIPYETQIMKEIDYAMRRYGNISKKMLLFYDREAFYCKDDPNIRLTFDNNILWRDSDLILDSSIYGTPLMNPDSSLLELKVAGSIPLWLVNLLRTLKISPTSFSKYGFAYKALKNKKSEVM